MAKTHLRDNLRHARCGITFRTSVALTDDPEEVTCRRCRILGDIEAPAGHKAYNDARPLRASGS